MKIEALVLAALLMGGSSLIISLGIAVWLFIRFRRHRKPTSEETPRSRWDWLDP